MHLRMGAEYECFYNVFVYGRTTARWRCWRKRLNLLNWSAANSRPRNHSSRCVCVREREGEGGRERVFFGETSKF